MNTTRLSARLDQYPADPKFAGMSEEDVMAFACKVVDEVRQDGKDRQSAGPHLLQPQMAQRRESN